MARRGLGCAASSLMVLVLLSGCAESEGSGEAHTGPRQTGRRMEARRSHRALTRRRSRMRQRAAMRQRGRMRHRAAMRRRAHRRALLARRRHRRMIAGHRAAMRQLHAEEAERRPEEAAAEAGPGECDPNYAGACLDPNAYDYDCAGGSGDGPEYTGTVTVVGEDHYGLDADGDGTGCETG